MEHREYVDYFCDHERQPGRLCQEELRVEVTPSRVIPAMLGVAFIGWAQQGQKHYCHKHAHLYRSADSGEAGA